MPLTKPYINMHYLRSFFSYVNAHKVISFIVVVVLVGGGYYAHSKAASGETVTKYVLSQVTKQTIISSVTGTGQISASNEVDLLPKASGTITYVGVTEGEQVKAGTVIARIDDTDAEKTLRDAQTSLQNSEITYQKSLQQNVTTVATGQQGVDSASTTLTTAYQDAYTDISNAFIDMPDISVALNDIYYTPGHSDYYSDDQSARLYGGDEEITLKYKAGAEFDQANFDYTSVFAAYKALSPATASTDQLDQLLSQTLAITKEYSEALSDTYNAIDYINLHIVGGSATQRPKQIATDESELTSFITKANADVSALQSETVSIENDKTALDNAQRTLSQTLTASNNELSASDNLDVQSADIALQQQQNAVQDAEDDLANYVVTAPFDGTVAKLTAKVDANASDGTAVATMLSPQQIATVSLNEVDAAKVAVGQKATITFDALPDLTLTGKVVEVDTVGTVSQGVVTYNVEIGLDTINDSVKAGMTATADIITDLEPDVIAVPNSAIKTSGSSSYVSVVSPAQLASLSASASSSDETTGVTLPTPPQSVEVQTGISNDTDTEITSGLNVGDTIVTRTVTAAAKTTTTSQTASLGSILGGSSGATRGGGAAGGGFRATP